MLCAAMLRATETDGSRTVLFIIIVIYGDAKHLIC